MKQISSILNGCTAVSNEILNDSRGYFVKAFQKGDFVKNSFELDHIDEVFWTESSHGVVRGLHLQLPPKALSKYVMCTQGRILDIILDLRSDSETFRQVQTVELGPSDGLTQGIFIPRGFAHGFITLSEVATVVYLQKGIFSAKHDTGVSFESVKHLVPEFMEVNQTRLSDRDKSLLSLEDFPNYTSADWNSES